MKTISIILGIAFLIMTAVMISLVRSGGALKPQGLIRPSVIGESRLSIGEQVAIRLFPEFQESKNSVWRIEGGANDLADIVQAALASYRGSVKPSLIDLRSGAPDTCTENCWYLQSLEASLPDSVAKKLKDPSTVDIVIQKFDRKEEVPASCESEKILTIACMRPVSVREVRRKIKTPAPHFFMQRYLDSEFFLFIERGP
jgi:hypothetical protein